MMWVPCAGPGKIGYGTASEALAMKKPFVFVRRDFFSEEPFLRKMLEVSRAHSPGHGHPAWGNVLPSSHRLVAAVQIWAV